MGIVLPTGVVKSATNEPKFTILYGPSKVGKSTFVSLFPGMYLVIDTEDGYTYLDAMKATVNNLDELRELRAALREPPAPRYDAIFLDTADKIVEWVEKAVKAENNVADIADMEYGKGYSLVRNRAMEVVRSFKSASSRLIMIGHRDRRIIGDKSVEVKSDNLDLPGKFRNMILADADAIGYVFREDGQLKISFKNEEHAEVGSRCQHLRGQIINADWTTIFPSLKNVKHQAA